MSAEAPTFQERVEKNTILRCVAGSDLFDLNLGSGDRDELGVCIEDIEDAMGLSAPFEQFVYRSAAKREGRHDAPSQPGDLDLTIYGLRKFLRLALKGNPTIMSLLFAPNDKCIVKDALGMKLQELAPHIVSRQAGNAFMGYFVSQKQRLLGERGQMRVHRTELVCEHGYDTKYAMHMLRLGLQGVELMNTGRLAIPMHSADRELLLAVRRGEWDLQELLTFAGEIEVRLQDAMDSSELPATPNEALVEEWMLRTYFMMWKARVPFDKLPKIYLEKIA